ncbi:MAG TPA: hypothetical protein VMT12_11275 [Syntrophales bacterium]|nr:hypothetical protein [Syntrophales bacterium]
MLGVAVIGGAWWAVYQWRLQRSYETALEIELVKKCAVYRNNLFVVFIDVSLKNVSRCKLAARAKNYANGSAQPVYEDELETIKHSVGLQLRSIRSDIENNLSLNWFNSTELLIPENIPSEINLLTDYEIESGERIEQMWIEPGETTHVGCAIILPAGHYLAKVTFVGAREFDDFWRRLFYIHVPELEK